MAICRIEHALYGDKVKFKAMLYKKHLAALKRTGKDFDAPWVKMQIERYEISGVESENSRE